MKFIRKFLMLILLAVFLFSGWKVVTLGMEYFKSEESYEALEQYVSIQTQPQPRPETLETAGTVPASEETSASEPEEVMPLRPQVDFEALAEINADIVGWICIPDTKINYPVVYRDNVFYLKHLFTGEYNSGGCIFLDERNAPDYSDSHSILYGHHMKDGSMFAGITAYRDQGYYDVHPTGLLMTPNGIYEIRFFSCYVADTRESAWNLTFSGGDFGEWVDEISRKSYFLPNMQPTAEDRILTLSTCTYDFENARFVLHGVIVPVEG